MNSVAATPRLNRSSIRPVRQPPILRIGLAVIGPIIESEADCESRHRRPRAATFIEMERMLEIIADHADAALTRIDGGAKATIQKYLDHLRSARGVYGEAKLDHLLDRCWLGGNPLNSCSVIQQLTVVMLRADEIGSWTEH